MSTKNLTAKPYPSRIKQGDAFATNKNFCSKEVWRYKSKGFGLIASILITGGFVAGWQPGMTKVWPKALELQTEYELTMM